MTNDRVLSGTRIARGPSAPSFLWLVLTSGWLVLVLVPLGLTAWLGFAIIGAIVVRPRWLVASAIYLVTTLVATFALSGTPQATVGLALYSVAFVHAMIANRTWLSILWGRIERGEPLVGRAVLGVESPAAPVATMPTEADALLGPAGGSTEFFDATRVPTAPIDVNAATRAQLAAIPGISPQAAAAAIAHRETAAFTSLQQFADTIGLQPHEFARARSHLLCAPRPTPRPRGGRRIDL